MKGNVDLHSEDILGMRSEVEPLTPPQSTWDTFHEEETEEDITEIASSLGGEEAADLEEEWADKTERGAKPVLGLEIEPEEQPLDDPVLMYLHEIGKVSLLTSNDEKVLASKLEEAKYLEKIEGLRFQHYWRYPLAGSTTIYLLRH